VVSVTVFFLSLLSLSLFFFNLKKVPFSLTAVNNNYSQRVKCWAMYAIFENHILIRKFFLILQGVHVGQIALLPVLLNVSHHVALHLLLPQCQCLDPQDNQAAWDPPEHRVVVEHQVLWDQWALWVQWDLQEHPECPAWLLLLSSVHQSACAGQPPFLQEEGCLR